MYVFTHNPELVAKNEKDFDDANDYVDYLNECTRIIKQGTYFITSIHEFVVDNDLVENIDYFSNDFSILFKKLENATAIKLKYGISFTEE